jgi:hypothetical protein
MRHLRISFQDSLDDTEAIWNMHRIRPYRNRNCPSGKPFLLYHTPEIVGVDDHMKDVPQHTMDACAEECTWKGYPCDKDVYEVCRIIMHEQDWRPPTDTAEATELYLNLRRVILREIGI